MPVFVVTVILFFLRRLRLATVALLVYRAWRALPARHRRQILVTAGRTGPRLAYSLTRRALPRR